jgi:hypothetical protein
MANNISVALGDIETIPVGFLAIVTDPAAVWIVTGNWAAAVCGAVLLGVVVDDLVDPELEHPAARNAVAANAATAGTARRGG